MSEGAVDGAGGGRSSGPFSPAMALGLALVGIFAFAALVVLTTFAPELTTGDDGGGHALSRSGLGFMGVTRLLRETGAPVLVTRGRASVGSGEGLLVLTPAMESDPKDLTSFSFKGPILLVLPKWEGFPDPRHRAWVVRGPAIPAANVAGRDLTPFGENTAVWRRPGAARPVLTGVGGAFAGADLRPGSVDEFQTVVGGPWRPLITDDQGRGVLLYLPGSRYYLLSDPDLLNTHGVKDLETARAALALLTGLRRGDAPILFDVTLHGLARERSLLRLAFGPPFLGMTLVLAFAALLMGLHALARFGPPRRAGRVIAFGKRGLVDNTAGLVRLAHREPSMAAPYLALTRAAVARALTAPRDMDDTQLDAFLERLSRKKGLTHGWADLVARAGKVRGLSDLTAVARDLFVFKREMSRDP